MNYPNFGTAYTITTVGATVVTSANAAIIGLMFNGSATGDVQIWAGVTATVTSATSGGVQLSGIIRGFATTTSGGQVASYYPFPAYCSGGITINIGTSADPRLTLFWNPAGGA